MLYPAFHTATQFSVDILTSALICCNVTQSQSPVCPWRCGTCGGKSCGSFGGGPSAGLGTDFCCINPIVANDELCTADVPGAPCVICEFGWRMSPRAGSDGERRFAWMLWLDSLANTLWGGGDLSLFSWFSTRVCSGLNARRSDNHSRIGEERSTFIECRSHRPETTHHVTTAPPPLSARFVCCDATNAALEGAPPPDLLRASQRMSVAINPSWPWPAPAARPAQSRACLECCTRKYFEIMAS